MILFCDGFDHMTLDDLEAKWDDGTNFGQTGYIWIKDSDPAPRRSGSKYLALGDTYNINISKSVNPTNSVIIVGAAVYHSTFDMTDGGLFQFMQNAGEQATITISSAGAIDCRRGTRSGTILQSTDNGTIKILTWQYIEVKIKLANIGHVSVKVDGDLLLDEAFGDFQAEDDAGCEAVRMVGCYQIDRYFDDLVIIDEDASGVADFIGDVRIDTLYPTADGTYTTWDRSGGSTNEENIDEETPDGDTSYVYTATTDEVDSYTFQSVPSPSDATIHAVVLTAYARKDDAGEVTIQGFNRSTDDDDYASGTDIYLSDNYRYYQYIWEDNPDDSAAWADADVDGAEFGLKLTS